MQTMMERSMSEAVTNLLKDAIEAKGYKWTVVRNFTGVIELKSIDQPSLKFDIRVEESR